MSNLHSPKVFQSLMVLSLEAETICLLSAENETERTSLVCPTNRRVVDPVLRSQSRRVWSHDEERANWPAGRARSSKVGSVESSQLGMSQRRRTNVWVVRGLTVGRDDDVRDKVVVSLQDLLGETVLAVITGELPDDDALV